MDAAPLGRWVEHAACRGAPDALFFPERPAAVPTRLAKALCAACPVLEACRAYAIGHPEERGIWGGLTGLERARLRRGHPAERA